MVSGARWKQWAALFAANECGAITILAVVFFVLILGVAGLAIDLGRLYNLHSQMQSYVDSVALAAAAELDNNSNALNRAASAAVGNVGGVNAGPVVTGVASTTKGASAFSIKKLEFYSSIAADPAPPAIASAGDVLVATYQTGAMALAGGLTTAQANNRAKYVKVTANSVQVTYFLLPLIKAIIPGSGMPSTQGVALEAVAGFKREVCDNAPIMMCNPYETGGNLDFTPVRGQGIIARQGAVPGGWNDLCPNGNACRDLLGLRDPNTQCVSVTLPGKPGQTTGPVRVGLNTRFDMYDSPFKPNQEGADPQFAPAKNVTRGMANVSNACNPGTSNSTFPLPDDNCLGAGGSCVASGIGDGSWGRHTYWAKNHAGVSEPAGYGTMTRYDVYLWELANPPGVSTADETSGPRCSSQGNATMRPNEDRRVLLAPIVNCNSDSSLQNIIGFGRFFMLEPVDVHTRDGQSQSLNGDTAKWASTGNTDIRLEVIDKVNANAPNGILNEYPVLYR